MTAGREGKKGKVFKSECWVEGVEGGCFPSRSMFPIVGGMFPIVECMFPIVEGIFPIVEGIFPIDEGMFPIAGTCLTTQDTIKIEEYVLKRGEMVEA